MRDACGDDVKAITPKEKQKGKEKEKKIDLVYMEIFTSQNLI